VYMCVRGVDFAPVDTIFLLDFGTVSTVWYFLFFILFHETALKYRYLALLTFIFSLLGFLSYMAILFFLSYTA